MNILKKIKYLFFGETIKVQNPFFGEMVDAGSYYECKKYFQPIDKEVEIGLEKTTKELEKKQIIFFNWLENNYDFIIEKISSPIENKIIEWLPNYQIQNFKKEFELEYFFIPICNSEIFDWQISFWVGDELQHWCTLEMKGSEVKSILIDG